jgi:hypothetical protein
MLRNMFPDLKGTIWMVIVCATIVIVGTVYAPPTTSSKAQAVGGEDRRQSFAGGVLSNVSYIKDSRGRCFVFYSDHLNSDYSVASLAPIRCRRVPVDELIEVKQP